MTRRWKVKVALAILGFVLAYFCVALQRFHHRLPATVPGTALTDSVAEAENMDTANTIVKTYPIDGTGAIVDISKDFDPNVFNAFCDTEETLKAVIPVYSAADRFDLRNIFRNTLGKWATKLNCKLFFIVGVSLNNATMGKLREEYVRERDILMIRNVDSYHDLNDKAVAMVRWISEQCLHVPYVIHLIDDCFINIKLFLDRMESLNETNYILGGYKKIGAPRNPKMKTFVTKEEYPEHKFPEFAIGFAYAFPTNVSKLLLSAAYKAPYVWIEDVWFTGHVRATAGVRLITLKRTEWKADHDKPVPHLLDSLPPYFIVHSVEPELFYKLYSTVS